MSAGLPKASIVIPLGVSLQTDVDDKLLPRGKVLELENVVRGRTGELAKRYGTTALTNNLIAGGTMHRPYALATHKGALVNLSEPGKDDQLYVYSSANTAWSSDAAQSGGALNVLRRGPISLQRFRQLPKAIDPDVAYSAGYYFVTYTDTGLATVYQDVIDATTGALVFHRSVAASPSLGYRVVVCNGRAVFLYFTGGFLTYDILTLASISAGAVTIGSGIAVGTAGATAFDVRIKDATTIQACFPDGANLATAVDFAPASASQTAWTPRTAAAAAFSCDRAMCWVQDFGGSAKIGIAVISSGAGLTAQWDFPTSGVTRNAAASYIIDAGATTAAYGFGGVSAHTIGSLSTGDLIFLYVNNTTNVASIGKRNGSGISANPLARGVKLRSKTWTYGGAFYALFENPVAAQWSRFVLQIPNAVQASIVPLAITGVQAGTLSLTRQFCSVPATGVAGQFVLGTSVLARLEQNDASFFLGTDANGVDLITVQHGMLPNTTIGPPREALDSLFVPDGMLAQFDGATFAEAGFAYPPDGFSATPTPQAGGSLTGGATYFTKFVYRHQDASGRVWRSAPSGTVQQVLAAGEHGIAWVIPTLRLTGWATTIEIYRGAANDNAFFQRAGTVANSTTADTVAFTDTTADASLGETLYTVGGVRANDTIPGSVAQAVWNNRLAFIAADDKQAIWPSEEFTLGNGLRFSSANVIDVKDKHGDLRALGVIDDKLVPFKDDAIYVIAGDGPNSVGQGEFSRPQPVALGVGCSNPQAMVETDRGILFKSNSKKAGFFLLDRGLSVNYEIGAPVQRYASEIVTGAVLVPQQSQARFYTQSGRTLVFDLVTSQWSTFTGQPADTATVYQGAAVYSNHLVTSVRVEDTSGATYTEAGTLYVVRVVTPWLCLGGLRAYERLYRIAGIGETAGAHTLTIELLADYDDDPLNELKNATATPGQQWDWELNYSAKRSAFKVVLSEDSSTAGAKMTALDIEYGLRRAHRPGAPSKRAA